MTWIQDAESCLIWAGPKVRFPLELELLYQDIEFEKTLTYSLDDERGLVAFGQIRMFDNRRGHFARIIVDPSSRGKGIGRIFCEELINEAKKLNCRTISLKVDKDNATAVSLYKMLGFVTPSNQPDNLRDDIIYMEQGQLSSRQD